MINSKARGQITIVDLNDSKAANVYLSSNYGKSQIFEAGESGDTFNPNWAASGKPLTITPKMLVAGEPNPKFGDMVWKITGLDASGAKQTAIIKAAHNDSYTEFSQVLDGTHIDSTDNNSPLTTSSEINSFYGASVNKSGQLIINKNMSTIDSLQIEFESVWVDMSMVGTGKDIVVPVAASISYDKRINTGSLLTLRIDPYPSDQFAYDNVIDENTHELVTKRVNETVKLTAVLIRGTVDDYDSTDNQSPFEVTWYIPNASSTSDEDEWTELTNANGTVSDGKGGSIKKWTVNGNVLTVYPDGVDNMEYFRAVGKDTQEGSPTYNKLAEDRITVYDGADPFGLDIESDNGTTFINGDINTTITAYVTYHGVRVKESVQALTVEYDWLKMDRNGNVDSAVFEKEYITGTSEGKQIIKVAGKEYDGTVYSPKTTDLKRDRQKSIVLRDEDVNRKATFICTATIGGSLGV